MINKIIQLLFFCLMLVVNNKILADPCGADDLECQKTKVMEEAGIRPLVTRDPEKAPDVNNTEAKPFELPAPGASNRAIINPGLDFVPQPQSLELTKAINEAKQAANQTPVPDINIPPVPAPKLEALKASLTSGAAPVTRPVGGSAIFIPPSPQLAPSIYR